VGVLVAIASYLATRSQNQQVLDVKMSVKKSKSKWPVEARGALKAVYHDKELTDPHVIKVELTNRSHNKDINKTQSFEADRPLALDLGTEIIGLLNGKNLDIGNDVAADGRRLAVGPLRIPARGRTVVWLLADGPAARLTIDDGPINDFRVRIHGEPGTAGPTRRVLIIGSAGLAVLAGGLAVAESLSGSGGKAKAEPAPGSSPAADSPSSGATAPAASAPARSVGVITNAGGQVNAVAFSPDGSTLASGGTDYDVHLWDVATREQSGVLTGGTDALTSVAYNARGTTLAAGCNDDFAYEWNPGSHKQIGTVQESDSVQCVAFSPDGAILAVTDDKLIQLVDVATGKSAVVLTGHEDSVTSIAFSPDGSRLVSGSYDNSTRIWDVHDGQNIQTLHGHAATVNAVAFSPDGTGVASASDDATIVVWNAASGQQLTVLSGNQGSVKAVAYDPRGGALASGGGDHTVRVWDLASAKQIKALIGHGGVVNTVAYAPDGSILASGSADRSIRLWA
jgi:WD domain, G-beta repeat